VISFAVFGADTHWIARLRIVEALPGARGAFYLVAGNFCRDRIGRLQLAPMTKVPFSFGWRSIVSATTSSQMTSMGSLF
jgi:hypothetical protein